MSIFLAILAVIVLLAFFAFFAFISYATHSIYGAMCSECPFRDQCAQNNQDGHFFIPPCVIRRKSNNDNLMN